uniref:glucose-6-phosphatase n=1 Tax=Schistosoma mansoni TaxID=6183 RepID=A0A3Q0KLK1_SCHMA
MNRIHNNGIQFIQWIQNFEKLEPLFTVVSHIGSPNTAYSLTFPSAYYIDPTLGITTILCAALADWLNGILKWMLYGHRPYWWLTLNRSLTDPDLSVKQYPLTCETGPGSPSGHCMVSVASLTPIITYFYHRLKNRNHQRCLITLSCLVFGLIAISRCYLAAHFPHQVILGLISGITVGLLFSSPDGFLSPKNEVKINWLHVQTVYLLTHPNRLLWLGFGSFMFAYVFSVFLEYGIKVDPNWSITLAQSACLQPEWIHLSTSLMMGFSRIAGTATGLSLGLRLKPTHFKQSVLGTNSLPIILFSLLIVVISTRFMESMCNQLISLFTINISNKVMTSHFNMLHLFNSFLQGTICPFITVFIVPTGMNLFYRKYN